MHKAFAQVLAFNRKHDFPIQRLKPQDVVFAAGVDDVLIHVAEAHASVKQNAEESVEGSQCHLLNVRLMLILEETRELIEAMVEGREVAVADAVADLAYVVIGTGVALDIPLPEVFDEVHRSNMTKDVGGVKPRGSSYEKPNIMGAICRGRVKP